MQQRHDDDDNSDDMAISLALMQKAVRRVCRTTDLTKLIALKEAIAKLQDKVSKGIKAAKMAKYEARARRKFAPVRQRFLEEALVGDVIAAWSLRWVWPSDDDEDDDHDHDHDHDDDDSEERDGSDSDDGAETEGRWHAVRGAPWYVHNSVFVTIGGIVATTKNIGEDFVVADRLCDHGDQVTVEDNHRLFPIGARHMEAVTAACEALLNSTKPDLLRKFAANEKVCIDSYVDAQVDLQVGITVIRRCWMSAIRVEWMTAVIRGVQVP
jgi:hypothetical protein